MIFRLDKIRDRSLEFLLSVILAFSVAGCVSLSKDYPIVDLRVNNEESKDSSFFHRTLVSPYELVRYIGTVEEAERRMMDSALKIDEEDQWLWYEINGKSHFDSLWDKAKKITPKTTLKELQEFGLG